ncbi:MAG: hypothetical protein Q9M92_04660 [Enterobacterales bacterium]|nr:hypothetical protein [Enterobacterales bacterium]
MKTKTNSMQSRLGSLLVKNHSISELQLQQALNYQQKRHIKLGTALLELHLISRTQLKIALKKQSWIRAFATFIALIFTPFNYVFADNQASTSYKQRIVKQPNPNSLSLSSNYLNTTMLDQSYAYSGQWQTTLDDQYGFKRQFNDKTGFKISFFSPYTLKDNEYSYQFEPQISLFQSSSIAIKNYYSDSNSEQNRYTRPSPITYMLTLKGRCLYENAGESSKIWGFSRADSGVQRNAELMLSVTKFF